ncbi:MAG TPA: hypothetical protein VF588_20450 [Pyrinomonadaceae bacterium]|jgi:hypothetical protein
MLQIATLFLAVIVLQNAPPVRPGDETRDAAGSVIDLAACKPATSVVYSKFGSEKVVVKGRRGSKCVIERTSEMEGAYVSSQCRVPVSRGKLTLAERPEPALSGETNKSEAVRLDDISKHCKVVKTGNLLLERQ